MDMKETDGGGANEKDTLSVGLDGCGTRYIIAQGGREAAVERERRRRPETIPRSRGSIFADLVGGGSRTGEGFACAGEPEKERGLVDELHGALF
jgi:hypothetical protein